MSKAIAGYRKVGRVFFVMLDRCDLSKWDRETKLAAFQLGLTSMSKVIVVPDIPVNRDLLHVLHPWIYLEAKTTDECREMLKVPDGVSWQELRDNIPEPDLGHQSSAIRVATKRDNFVREIQWLKEEMRQRLKINYIKPLDRLDPMEKAKTLFLFDNAAKQYWINYTKDKLRDDRRFSRFYATPERGFNDPSTGDALSIFFEKSGRGDRTMYQYSRGVPLVGTTLSKNYRHSRLYSPLTNAGNPNSDTQLRLKGHRSTSGVFYTPKFNKAPFHTAKAA